MKKILVIGCNEVTRRVVNSLCEGSFATDILIADQDKAIANELKAKINPGRVRITTAGVDVTNEERTLLMVNIFGPEMIINLLPEEFTMNVLNLALKIKVPYVDSRLVSDEKLSEVSLLSKQFELFADFRSAGLTAICGAGFNPCAITAITKAGIKNDVGPAESVNIISLEGDTEKPTVVEAPSKKEETVEEEEKPLLTLKDLEENEEESNQIAISEAFASSTDVTYVENRQLKTISPDLMGKTDSLGRFVSPADSSVVADFYKEIPEVSSIMYFAEPVSTIKVEVKDTKKPYVKNTEFLEKLEKIGMLSKEPIEINGISISPFDFLSEVLKNNEKPVSGTEEVASEDKPVSRMTKAVPEGIGCYEIYVKGKEKSFMYRVAADNKETMEKYNMTAREYFDSCSLLAVIKLIINGKISRAGVFTPCAFDENVILTELKIAGLTVETVADREF